MRKKLLACILTMCMFLSLLPTTAWAAGESCTGDNCAHEAAIGDMHYATLTEALAAATGNETVKLLKDIDNSVNSKGMSYSLKPGATLDGDGHTISGYIGVRIPEAGATVTNIKFQSIHNLTEVDQETCKYYGWESKTGNQSAIYASNLTGVATITNCTFDNIDWDAIQITPAKNSSVVITGNVFTHSDPNGTQLRYIHIENTGFSSVALAELTVTDNQFFKSKNTSDNILCSVGIWNVKNTTATLKLDGNYLEDASSAEVTGIGTNYLFPSRSNPAADTDDYQPVAYGTSEVYDTLQAAVTGTKKYVKMMADTDGQATIPQGKTITFYSYGHKIGTLTNNGDMLVYGTDQAVSSKIVNNGALSLNDKSAAVYEIENNGALSIAKGEIYDLSKITGGGTITITGGTFSTRPDAKLLEKWYKATEQSGEPATYKVSKMSVNEAVQAGLVATSTSMGGTFYESISEGLNSTEAVTAYLRVDREEDARLTVKDGKMRSLYLNGKRFTGSIAMGTGVPELRIIDETAGMATLKNITGDKLSIGMYNKATKVEIQDADLGTLDVAAWGDCTVKGGQYGNLITNVYYSGKTETTATTETKLSITGGSFASDVVTVKYANHEPSEGTAPLSDYVAEGYTVVEGSAAYPFKVVARNTTAPAEVVPSTPSVEKPSLDENASEEAKELASSVEAALTSTETDATAPSISALTTAANKKAEENELTSESAEVTAALKEAEITPSEDKPVTIVIQPYMDIKIIDVSVDGEGTGTAQTVTLDITPMYRTVATTAALAGESPEEIVLDGTEDKPANAVQIGEEEKLPINVAVEVVLPLPAGFSADNSTLYIKHVKGDNGPTYYYTGTVTENVLKFKNPNGFSEFTLMSTNEAVAEIGEVGYPTLQAAVNAAVEGDVVEVKRDDGALSATMGGASRTITIKNGTESAVTVKINGTEYKLDAKDATAEVNYTAPSAPSYAVAVSETANGSVTASHRSAGKGTTVTLTVAPDAGYKLDTLTVTDKDGKVLELTDKGDGKYTFTMPASKVDVKAVFAKADDQAPNFVDVPADAYYAEAVAWAVANGVTNGTSATTFSPDAVCTRAQVVTFLWRAAGSPKAAGSNPFTDVKPGDYYYDAVLWAVANGITNGTSATTFSPDATVTRGQTVTFLHRSAGSPAVTGSNPFTDVAAGAYYADAVVWAVETGVTNGMSPVSFAPESGCTRGQIVTFLFRDRA